MRLKHNPHALTFLADNPDIVLPFLPLDKPVTAMEIGIGKGDFIVELAKKNIDVVYLGVEKFSTVLAHAAKKVLSEEVKNVYLLNADASKLGEVIPKNSLDVIYLNFSDPWPKKRHHKRRLTAPSFLQIYFDLLKSNGQLIIKTDSADLYYYSLETLPSKFKITQFEEDYQFEETDAMSEYERKFRQRQQNIYRIKGVKND